jgi:hypothetical protein
VTSASVQQGGTCTQIATQLLIAHDGDDVSPRWSPDGNFIAYTAFRSAYPDVHLQHVNAVELTLTYEGGQPVSGVDLDLTALTANSTARNFDPAWSPDGSKIVFVSTDLSDARMHILQLSINGTVITLENPDWRLEPISPTTFAPYGGPDWTPPFSAQPQCEGSLRDPISPPYETIRLWDRPEGSVIERLNPGEPVILIDGVNRFGWWWWHIRVISDPTLEGYVREDVVINSNNCPENEVEPQPLPLPRPNESCFVRLTAASAEVRNGKGETHQEGDLLGTITDPSLDILVYGTSNDRSLLLISQPGILDQQWVIRSLFTPNPLDARACKPNVLGRFNRDIRQPYWTAVGFYANNFLAPISPTQFANEYGIFRNSVPYSRGGHTGVDLVYRPPDGMGNSISFEVHAQANGVVVDAGPDGITQAHQFERIYTGVTEPPGNRFAGRPGTFYWTEQLSADSWKVTYYVAMTGDRDDDPDNNGPERPNAGYNPDPFGITVTEYRGLIQDNFSPVCTRAAGCIDGPGRQIIIWYQVSGSTQPVLQTIYYHISVDELPQYQQLRQVCSANRNTTWTNVVIQNNANYNVCRVTTGNFLGHARLIGFATAPHLHYEIFVDRDNNGQFERPAEREDPLMAFSTIR